MIHQSAYTILAIALGGASGAVCRYLISVWAMQRFPAAVIPIGTLTANAVGALMIGVLYVLIVEKTLVSESWRPILVVGFLGALTTFSTFSIEVTQFIHRGEWLSAALYIVLSVLLCVVLTSCGVAVARLF